MCFCEIPLSGLRSMTQFLPPNLLALFAARDPIPFKPSTVKVSEILPIFSKKGHVFVCHCNCIGNTVVLAISEC